MKKYSLVGKLNYDLDPDNDHLDVENKIFFMQMITIKNAIFYSQIGT